MRTLNILVIKMSAIGDVILSVPSLRAIRAKYPNAVIKVLVGIQSREILDGCPYVNELIVCDLKGRDKGMLGLWKLGKLLRKSCFDIAIDLQNSKKSHILSALSLAALRYGYDNRKSSFLLNKKIKDDAPYLDPIEHQSRTLKLAGVKLEDRSLHLWPSGSDEEAARKFLSDNWVKPEQALVGINIRASGRWVTKNWPASSIAALSDRLAKELNIRVVLTGAAEDAEFANHILKETRSKPIIAVGRTSITELACLMKRFSVFLTPDSAPMHIASAVGVPFVALFGPTDPARHIASRSGNCVVIYKADELKCIPCYSPTCMKNFLCMKKITVDEVFDAMRNFLVNKKEVQIESPAGNNAS